MLALLLAAVVCLTPEGSMLSLGSRIDPQSDDIIRACRQTGNCGGWRYVADNPGTWFIVGWECGTNPISWPAGRNVAIVTDKGDTLAATDLLAMSPPYEQRVIPLGRSWVMLNPQDLWCPKRGKPKLYARFPPLTGRPTALILTQRR